MDFLKIAGGLVLAAVAGPALAHVSASPREAVAGAYQVVRFGVGHGCPGAAATVALRLEMPAGLGAARPQPKPGWALEIETAGDTVQAVVWRGRLPADQFDEFVVLMRLPEQPGTIFIPAIQTCDQGESRWTQTAPPETTPRPTHPAPSLRLLPAQPAAAAAHQHH